MFTMLVSIFTWVTFVILWGFVSAAVAIYLFINSQKHKMNKVLWSIIGLLFNIFGLCAYYIARDKNYKKCCPACGAKTNEYDTFCPVCDVKLETVRPEMKLITKIFIGICVFIAAAIIWSEISGILFS